jgi:phosphoribosyl-AMP cyclohydrolase
MVYAALETTFRRTVTAMNTSSESAPENDLELGSELRPRFDDRGLIPAVATDHETGEVLMLAWMNAEALARTIELGEAVYWSRSRNELWHKGATSGHVQKVRELRIDCDQDTLWLRVEQHGPGCCHTGHRSCFYRRVPLGPGEPDLGFTEEARAFDPRDVYGT